MTTDIDSRNEMLTMFNRMRRAAQSLALTELTDIETHKSYYLCRLCKGTNLSALTDKQRAKRITVRHRRDCVLYRVQQ